MLVYVFLQHFSQLFSKSSGSEVFEVHVSVNGMVFEVLVLFGQSDSHFDLVVDILL